MARIDFFVDTNVLIYDLEGHPSVMKIKRQSFTLGISVISEIELLGKKNVSQNEINSIRNLLNDCEIIALSDKIKETAISLKQKYSIKTSDAIIAATAKCFNSQLLTADKDFEKISDDVDIVILDLI